MDTDTKFTKGPYRWAECDVQDYSHEVYGDIKGDCSVVVARCTNAANAKFLALAPDMLELLRFIAGHARMAVGNFGANESETLKNRTSSLNNIACLALDVISQIEG